MPSGKIYSRLFYVLEVRFLSKKVIVITNKIFCFKNQVSNQFYKLKEIFHNFSELFRLAHIVFPPTVAGVIKFSNVT